MDGVDEQGPARECTTPKQSGWMEEVVAELSSIELARSRRVALSAADFFLALWLGKGFGGKVWSDR